jgi:hypothetical protein
MIIDTDAHAAASFAEMSQNLYPQCDLDDRDRLGEDPGNSLGEIDDAAIIWRFAQGKKRLVVNRDLRIDYAHNSLQLSTPDGELIAIHKIAERLHYILVKKDSKYSEMIQNIISECQFIPIDAVTAERGFVRYQKYEIPQGYHLRYEPATALWETWQENTQQQLADGIQLDILILARLKWYRVQQMICTDDRLDLQTRLGLISFSLRDRIAWIAKLGDVPAIANADLSTHQNSLNGGSDSDILGKIISKLAIEAAPESVNTSSAGGEIDPNSNMSRSIFSPSHDSSLMYDADRSSTLTGNIVSPISEQLRASTLSVLEDYLEHGETIVRTETIVDAQGNPISEKTVSIHRGCPRWAIEAIVNWR